MNKLPEEMWFGKIDGQWPIHCWEGESQARVWVDDAKVDERRRVWKAKVVDPVEYKLVTPSPYLTKRDLGS